MNGSAPVYDASPSSLSAYSGFARNMTRSGFVSNLSRGPRITKSPDRSISASRLVQESP
jgi:hypothetical protein